MIGWARDLSEQATLPDSFGGQGNVRVEDGPIRHRVLGLRPDPDLDHACVRGGAA